MKKAITNLILVSIFAFSIVAGDCFAKSAQFSNFVLDHEKLQKRISNIEERITINSNLLNEDGADLRHLKKQLKKINKKHKKIYKILRKNFKIDKDTLALVKEQQKSMKLRSNSDELAGNLVTAYDLAADNNDYLESIIEDNKAKAYTESEASGLYGKLSIITGNCMPQVFVVDRNQTGTCAEESFASVVIIRTLTHVSALENFVNYKGSNEALNIVASDDNGVYKLDLAPGKYSVFLLDENNKEYCDSYDGQGNACAVEIKENMQSEFNISLDRASY